MKGAQNRKKCFEKLQAVTIKSKRDGFKTKNGRFEK